VTCFSATVPASALSLTLLVPMHPQLTLATLTPHFPAPRAATPLRAAGLLPPLIAVLRQKPAPALGATLPSSGRLGHGRAGSRWSSLCPQLAVICTVLAPASARACNPPTTPPALGSQMQSAPCTLAPTRRRPALATRAPRPRWHHSPRLPHRGAEPPQPPPHDGTPVRPRSPPTNRPRRGSRNRRH